MEQMLERTKIDIDKIEKAMAGYGYPGEVKEIRRGRKYWRIITDTDLIFLLDSSGWLRDYPSRRMIKKVI